MIFVVVVFFSPSKKLKFSKKCNDLLTVRVKDDDSIQSENYFKDSKQRVIVVYKSKKNHPPSNYNTKVEIVAQPEAQNKDINSLTQNFTFFFSTCSTFVFRNKMLSWFLLSFGLISANLPYINTVIVDNQNDGKHEQ